MLEKGQGPTDFLEESRMNEDLPPPFIDKSDLNSSEESQEEIDGRSEEEEEEGEFDVVGEF